MSITIVSKNNEKVFNKNSVTIGSNPQCDMVLNFGFEFLLVVNFDQKLNKFLLFNKSGSQNFLFKGNCLPEVLEIEQVCKIMVKGSDDFVTVRVKENGTNNTGVKDFTTNENQHNGKLPSDLKLKLEKKINELEKSRVAVIKECGFMINDLKRKIGMNSKCAILLHIALFLCSLICAFGVSNYLLGLPLSDLGTVLQMPVNIKFLFIWSVIIYSIGITLKQGVYLYLHNASCTSDGRVDAGARFSEKFMVITSLIFFGAIYLINLLYYSTSKSMSIFAIFISLFFAGSAIALSFGCGYFKFSGIKLKKELEKYEYRPDFEFIIKEYRYWIEKFINTLSPAKIENLQDKLMNFRLKSLAEISLGIITAPFLAYGVSNTLASCFPEAAGWVRISGLRFSPVFLVLSTFLIIFAFFSFVNAFTVKKKITASNIIKLDGFSNYFQHGVEIFGLEGSKKLQSDMRHSFLIAISIIFIEFSMNASYFMQEIGSDLNGIMLSAVAALVPTALLVAETFMLSQTEFEMYACEGVISKLNKE